MHSRWWLKKGSILADEMVNPPSFTLEVVLTSLTSQGLGKTVQIITLLSVLSARGSRPFLISVPNSTIGNCELRCPSSERHPLMMSLGMREFARWAPALRVVPYSVSALQ